MKNFVIVLMAVVALTSCEAKLSEDQRKALHEEMEDRKIKKISQEDIYKKALEEGRLVLESVDSGNIDSVKAACKCEISNLTSKDDLSEVELKLYEAYEFNPNGTDNIQKEGDQFLIYTKPQVANDSLAGLWMIKFPKSEIVKKI
ncbi:hypothetical protein [Fulvivirga lutimaris]|uniref:hypothetical protein n=1 Tax=Fulvivirga lutimaris TaxID=1819566 RepID=UPI0012BBE3A6|nr:hypothetical protein [Fulvivirga lutimaris]MTI41131.1 hypothetical protein [Fulvivirga lutimaris]